MYFMYTTIFDVIRIKDKLISSTYILFKVKTRLAPHSISNLQSATVLYYENIQVETLLVKIWIYPAMQYKLNSTWHLLGIERFMKSKTLLMSDISIE